MEVLVVDDDVVSRMVLMHLVDSCGPFDIVEAEDGQDAWEQLSAGLRPAICFCDLRMPRLSGMELLAKVKGAPAFADMQFVMVTSATETATVDQAAGLGADGYIVKPFQAEQVNACMAPFVFAPDVDCVGAGSNTETPQATMARLAIGAERLLIYLGGLQSQLSAASSDLAALLARGDHASARAQLERLHAGCLTLGLDAAALTLRAIPDGAIDAAKVQAVLAITVRDVMQQCDAVQRFQFPAHRRPHESGDPC